MGAPETGVLADPAKIARILDPLARPDVELDILNAFSAPPPVLDFVAPGLKAATAGVFASPGGLGKSMWSLELAMGVAAPAADEHLLRLGITKQGGVVVLNAEDPLDVLQLRVHGIGARLPVDVRREVAANLKIMGLMGCGCNVGNPKWVDGIIRIGAGARLIILDTLSRWHASDENDNSEMAAVIAIFERIARETGAAIVYLHHTSKGATLNGQGSSQQATRGASSIVDNARWQGYLERLSEAEAARAGISEEHRPLYVKAGVAKQNYGPPVGERWYRRAEGGVLVAVDANERIETERRPGKASRSAKVPPQLAPLAELQAAVRGDSVDLLPTVDEFSRFGG